MPMSWIATAVLSLAGVAPPQSAEAAPDLSGVWILDADESDDAGEKLQEAMRERFRGRRGTPGGPGAGPGSGGFPPGGGGRGFPGGPPDADGGGPQGPEGLFAGYERLEIETAPDEIQISYGDELRIYHPDGRAVDRQTERGRAKVQARWDDGRLVIESKGEPLDSREVFELERDTGRLVLTQVIDGRMGQVKIRRVYDRGEPEPTEPTPPKPEPQE